MLLRRLILAFAVLMIPGCGGDEPTSKPRPEAQGQPDEFGMPKGPATRTAR